MSGRLALVAGQGALPRSLGAALDESPLIAALEGFPPEGLAPDLTFRIERLGTFLADLGERDVTQVCFAGSIRRPPLDPNLVDAATLPLVPRMMAALGSGDDAALRTVLAIFEEAGFAIRAAHEIAPGLLASAGQMTSHTPAAHAHSDLVRAAAVHLALAEADVGQACVVHRGQVLAAEGVFGTDWMLQSLAVRPDGRGGLLYKAPKPGQDHRIDLPVIGPATVAGAATAGLDGIAVKAGGVLILDRSQTIAAAEAAGLFLWGVE